MQIRQFFTIILTILALITYFDGSHAHQDEVAGTHIEDLVTGTAQCSIFPFDDLFLCTSSCSAEASYGPSEDRFLSGSYGIKVRVANHEGVKPWKEKYSYFRHHLYEVVFDGIGQPITPTGLAGLSEGGGAGCIYLIMEIDEQTRYIPLRHEHRLPNSRQNIPGNEWNDRAPK